MKASSGRKFVSDLLCDKPAAWPGPKTLEEHLRKIGPEAIIFEDEHVVAYHQADHDTGSQTQWTHRIAIALRTHVPTLLDLDAADQRAATALLRAIQVVALQLDLNNEGFEIRADVLPPLQKNGFLEIKVRSGKHKTATTTAAPAALSSKTK